jgi:hypothetical protein
MNCLVAHCQTSGCYMRVPICTIATDTMPEFVPTLHVAVVCPSCGNEFRELASALEMYPQGDVTAKIQLGRKWAGK